MNATQVQEILLKCAALVRRGWCTGAPAKNADGKPVGPRDQDAVAWCAIGAIQKICGGPEDGWEARFALRQVLGSEGIQEWNDGRARDGEMVARMFEEAAKYAC
jgi:hypothetical protein